MNDERVFSLRNRWFVASVAGLAAFTVVSLVLGFVVLPAVQKDYAADGLWASICRAAGVPSRWAPAPTYRGATSTTVVMTAALGRRGDALQVGRGATLALQCTMCHGPRGLSVADAPNLAGQYPEVIYKQLRDYRQGHRASAVMQGLARGLSDDDMRDLAGYYAFLPRPTVSQVRGDSESVPALVRVGDPMRNIAPCASCHGGLDQKPGSPWLEGMSATYVRGQLQSFANGTRANDPFGQMRNVARNLTADEIGRLATYYSDRPETAAGTAVPPPSR